MSGKFTKTERAILILLADGVPHNRLEVHACLPDELGALKNIHRHISAIRQKLPNTLGIACILHDRQHKYLLYKPLQPAAAKLAIGYLF
jgi:hypothetical protein